MALAGNLTVVEPAAILISSTENQEKESKKNTQI